MKKTFSSLVLISLIMGCTANIKQESFIAQDEVATNYQKSELNNWRSIFVGHELTELSLTTKDKGATLKGIYIDNPESTEAILFIPGNGMKVSKTAIKAFNRLKSLGKDIVYFDRRGLGASSGKATISALHSDAIEKVQYIRTHLQPTKLIVHGFSLGSFIAGQIAKYEKIDALVLEGAATNVTDWIDQKTPWYMGPFLTINIDEAFHTVDNAEVVSTYYNGPLFILGAENDEQVPVSLSEKLYQLSQSSNKTLTIVEGAKHGEMLDGIKELEIYQNFLKSI